MMFQNSALQQKVIANTCKQCSLYYRCPYKHHPAPVQIACPLLRRLYPLPFNPGFNNSTIDPDVGIINPWRILFGRKKPRRSHLPGSGQSPKNKPESL